MGLVQTFKESIMAKKKKKEKEIDLNIGLSYEEKKDMDSCISSWDKESALEKIKDNKKIKNIIDNPMSAVFKVLKKNKIEKLIVKFSGGNDSGGSDGASVFCEGSDEELQIDISQFDICSILEKPIYDKYYGFAWNGEVNGECVWDVTDETVSLTGTEVNFESSSNSFEM